MKTKSKGTYVASYCASPWKVLATAQNKTGFTVEMTYTGSDGCQAFSETMTYSGCSAASGSYTNADGSTGTDSWTKVAAAKYTVPAGSLQQGLKSARGAGGVSPAGIATLDEAVCMRRAINTESAIAFMPPTRSTTDARDS